MKLYHLTEIKNLYRENGIASIGLIPQYGIRSKSMNDNRICISLISEYYTLPVWRINLYPYANAEDLCVLSVDVEEKEIENFNNKTEFFTNNIILPEKISIVHFYNKRTKEEIPFYYLQEDPIESQGWGDNDIPIEIEVIEETLTKIISQNEKSI